MYLDPEKWSCRAGRFVVTQWTNTFSKLTRLFGSSERYMHSVFYSFIIYVHFLHLFYYLQSVTLTRTEKKTLENLADSLYTTALRQARNKIASWPPSSYSQNGSYIAN
jgi:hypothetical protein